MNGLCMLAPAKLNLVLAVTGLAEGGLHTIDSILQSISLYDRVELRKSKGFSLRLPGSGVPPGPSNTVYKAAEVFFRETGLLAGADVVVHKTIPSRAGMGGGSADAAAVLAGLNVLYGARLPLAELCALGSLVGSDVPYCLMGGTVRVRGTGQLLLPLAPLPGCYFVVAMPHGRGVSTAEAYARFDILGSPVQADIESAAAAITAGALGGLLPFIANELQLAAASPYTQPLCEALLQCGAAAAGLTGSGAAVFGLFENPAAAQKAAACLRAQTAFAAVVQPVPHGPTLASSE